MVGSIHFLEPTVNILWEIGETKSFPTVNLVQLICHVFLLRNISADNLDNPTIWNSLPLTVRSAQSFKTFGTLLKSHLFKEAFTTINWTHHVHDRAWRLWPFLEWASFNFKYCSLYYIMFAAWDQVQRIFFLKKLQQYT